MRDECNRNPGSFLLTNTIGSVNHYNLLQLSQVSSNMRRRTKMIRFVAKKRRHTVSSSIRSFTYSRLTGAVAALWLCGAGPGMGGRRRQRFGDPSTMAWQISAVFLKTPYGVQLPSCPQAPTITQGVLQLAAWNLVPTEMISATNTHPSWAARQCGQPLHSAGWTNTTADYLALPITGHRIVEPV